MKPISTKAAMTAYYDLKKAHGNLRFYANAMQNDTRDGYWTKKWTQANAAVDAAEEVYNESLLPITEAIREAEGKRCSARKITADCIITHLADVTEKLGISKKAMEGIKVDIDPNAQSFPAAYKYIPESTQFCAEYKRGEWKINCIVRDTTKAPSNEVIVHHTDASKQALLNRFTAFAV